MSFVTIKELIWEITSSGNGRYFVVTRRHVYEYEGAKLHKSYDLPSEPYSKLHLGMNGWGIVCKHHIRTHNQTYPHAFRFFYDERIILLDATHLYCSKTPSNANEASLISITNDLPPTYQYLYQQDEFIWEIQPYNKELARRLKQNRLLFTSVKHNEPVLTAYNPAYGKILVDEHFLGGSPYGVLTYNANSVYKYSVHGLESKRIARIEGLQNKKSHNVFGALPEKDVFVVGWNEDKRGQWRIIHLIPIQSRLRRYITYIMIFMVTIILICLVFAI